MSLEQEISQKEELKVKDPEQEVNESESEAAGGAALPQAKPGTSTWVEQNDWLEFLKAQEKSSRELLQKNFSQYFKNKIQAVPVLL